MRVSCAQVGLEVSPALACALISRETAPTPKRFPAPITLSGMRSALLTFSRELRTFQLKCRMCSRIVSVQLLVRSRLILSNFLSNNNAGWSRIQVCFRGCNRVISMKKWWTTQHLTLLRLTR